MGKMLQSKKGDKEMTTKSNVSKSGVCEPDAPKRARTLTEKDGDTYATIQDTGERYDNPQGTQRDTKVNTCVEEGTINVAEVDGRITCKVQEMGDSIRAM